MEEGYLSDVTTRYRDYVTTLEFQVTARENEQYFLQKVTTDSGLLELQMLD